MNNRDLKQEIESYKENHELQRISTTYSDEMYPWTAGKAPWSVEQGGTGVTPTGARNNINITALKSGRRGGHFYPFMDSKDGIIKQQNKPCFPSLNPSNLEWNIKSLNELKHCYTLMQSLLEKAKTYHVAEADTTETDNVSLVIDEIDASLEVLKNTPMKRTTDQNHRLPSSPQRRIIKMETSPSDERRSNSPPRGYQSPPRSYAWSPDHDNRFSRSPNINTRSSRDQERERRYSNDRHRDDYERREVRDRASRR